MKLQDTYDVKYTVEWPLPFLWPFHTKSSVNSANRKGNKRSHRRGNNSQFFLADNGVFLGNSVLEETVRDVFKKIRVEIDERDVQACHRLKEKKRTIVKFVNRKDCLQILRVKKDLKSLDPTELDFPENTKIFINESLCPYYRGIWNKCKKLRAIQKIHQFYTISGLIRVKLEETGPSRIITHMVDLKELFPDIDIENL